ncbi:hypothetical protein GOODEAATRI_028371 [Goodea atripinnis]|uniref:Uncharacterized protein n=1 Tax=Goodea atripinnis TaxID=208336 RepID=A0ABV0NNV5_9TELE
MPPAVAAHLHPKTSLSADRFQSSLTDKSNRAAALSVRALNASFLLMAHQAELEEQMTASPDAALWEEVCIITITSIKHLRNPRPPRHSGRGPASHLHSCGKEEEAVGLTSSLDGGSEQGSLPSTALFPSPFEEFSRVQSLTERTFEPAQHATKKLRDYSDPCSRPTSTFFCSTEIHFIHYGRGILAILDLRALNSI